MIALALSGGGSRAIAFHLGCLRALYGRGILDRISVISSVSGGSVIAAMYAYGNCNFEEFDQRIVTFLRNGLTKAAALRLISPKLVCGLLATNLISRPLASIASAVGRTPPFPRWFSRSDALEGALESIFGKRSINAVVRSQMELIINACELRTGTSFRFGSRLSGNWRLGEIENNDVSVAHAVACSAAYPLMLPAFDREYAFVKNGSSKRHRVVLTDGGVYDNLGISCIEPGKDARFSLKTYSPGHIICCHAGYGQLSGKQVPYGMYSRLNAAFEANFRKLQDAGVNRLHMHKQMGRIRGFVLPYLGQQDNALPIKPADLVPREEVVGYPTDFNAMPDAYSESISRRGEQLTNTLLSYYCPEL
jgi:NTE family protein